MLHHIKPPPQPGFRAARRSFTAARRSFHAARRDFTASRRGAIFRLENTVDRAHAPDFNAPRPAE